MVDIGRFVTKYDEYGLHFMAQLSVNGYVDVVCVDELLLVEGWFNLVII